MNLNGFFRGIGYDTPYTNCEFKTIGGYLDWYRGFVDSFHGYYVYNGEKQVTKNRLSLGLPKRICENFADLLMNEKVKITLGTDEHTKILDEILQANNFFVRANQGIEKTFAAGTGCFLLSLDKDKKIKIQFVSAGNIYPLTFESDGIYECAFANKKMRFNKITKKSEQILDLQVHTLNEFDNYTIRNFRFIDGGNGDLTQVEVDDILPVFETNSDYRWFMPMLLSIKLGLDSDYFSFEKGVTSKTATEVIRENNKTFRTLKKHEQVLDSAIREMIQSIVKIGNQYGLFNINGEIINIDFDDRIIESKDQERLQDRQDIAIDAQGLVEYRMKWYGEDEDTASAKINEIKDQNNSNTSLEFLDGEIN